MLCKHALYLKRSDSVSGGLYDIVGSSDIPIIAVLILPRGVARMVKTVVPRLGGFLLIAVIALEESERNLRLGMNDNLAGDTGRHGLAVLVDDIHIVVRHRLTHRAGLRLHADAVCNKQGGLRLTEALHELYPRLLVPLVENIGVERLARDSAVFERAQIIGGHILLEHKSEHCGRAAEAGDFILFEYREYFCGMELVIVIDKNAALHKHLAVKLAPNSLAPAGIGYCQMNAVGVDIVPIFGGCQMCKGICVRVHCHFRISCSAGREIYYHRLIVLRFNSLEMRIGIFHIGHKVIPAVALAVDHYSRLYRGALRQSRIDVLGDLAVACADNRFYGSGIRSVNYIMLLEHESCGDNDRAELMQGENSEPELIMAFEYNHYHVAFSYAFASEHIGGLITVIF